MINFIVIEELNNLYEWFQGAIHATKDEDFCLILHEACHRMNEIIYKVKITNAVFGEASTSRGK